MSHHIKVFKTLSRKVISELNSRVIVKKMAAATTTIFLITMYVLKFKILSLSIHQNKSSLVNIFYLLCAE